VGSGGILRQLKQLAEIGGRAFCVFAIPLTGRADIAAPAPIPGSPQTARNPESPLGWPEHAPESAPPRRGFSIGRTNDQRLDTHSLVYSSIPQHLIGDMVTQACQKRRVDRAEHAGWGNTQLKVHLKRLEELEYLLVHRGGRGQSFVYELLYEAGADDGQRFLARLIDVDMLRHNQSGQNGTKSAQSRPQVGVKSGRSRGGMNAENPDKNGAASPNGQEVSQNANLDTKN
jgi:hypothetical protein